MIRVLKVGVVVVVVGAYAALGWIVGIAIVAIAASTAVLQLIRLRRALAETIACEWCGEPFPQFGEHECSNCRARTRGWLWRCSACAAEFGHAQCPSCGLSVGNPALRGGA